MVYPSYDALDPLSLAIAPPPDETEEQRLRRLKMEEQARRVSDQIDEWIGSERMAMKKKKKPIKVLLLGQSESGKSTTIKNFQLAYARQAWTEERASWRVVIHLNLVRSVLRIIDALTAELDTLSPSGSPKSPSARLIPTLSGQLDDEELASVDASEGNAPPPVLTEKHKLLRMRLGLLKGVQDDLEARLGSASTELQDMSLYTPSTSAAPFLDYEQSSNGLSMKYNPRRPREFFVRSNCGWKVALDKVRPYTPGEFPEESVRDHPYSVTGGGDRHTNRPKRTSSSADVIIECREDMKALWEDEVVRGVLAKRKIKLEDSPGFFLDDVDRIATREYEPSDNDIVRARLRTMGVQEYTFTLERGESDQYCSLDTLTCAVGSEWRIFDLAGARTSRATWFPYFDDVNAIIFLAPISCFDESLAEDRRVNRLEDTLLLWKSVCSSKLLSKVQLILFLNKIDLLSKKLNDQRILVRDYIPSYKDRKNDVETVTDYFRAQFKEILRTKSPERRTFYAYLTSVIDTQATARTLGMVQEGILRNYLKSADFL